MNLNNFLYVTTCNRICPCKMNFILVFFFLQAIYRVKFVFNSKLIAEAYEDEDEDEDNVDEWGFKEEYAAPLTSISKLISFEPSSQSSCIPFEVSPTSVAEMGVEDDFKITKEWIESVLIPTFKAGKMLPISVIKKV